MGRGCAEGRVQRETRTIDYAGAAKIVEAGAVKHVPWGTVLSFDETKKAGGTWAQEEDAAIWTGHYLAAQALRHAATGQPEALANIDRTLTGIERLFTVASAGAVATELPAVSSGGAVQTGFVDATAQPGVFARVAVPASEDGFTDGRLQARKC